MWQDEEHDHGEQVDVDIVVAVAAGRDPLDIEPLRRHLVSYALHWTADGPAQRADGWSGSGCMACGGSPVRLFVMTPEGAGVLPEDSPLWRTLRSHADHRFQGGQLHGGSSEDGEIVWPPLVNVQQALWRLDPESYFACVPRLPLLYMPVLLLCGDCSVLVERTHQEVGCSIALQVPSLLAQESDTD